MVKVWSLVGRFYNRGIYVTKDRAQAEHWLLRALDSSDPDAVKEAEQELQIGG